MGAVAVRDDDPANRQRIEGLTLASRLGEKTALTAEAARSRTDLQGEGQGQRFELRHEGAGLQAHVWGAHTDAGFYNPGSPQAAGQSQYGAKVGYTLNAGNRIVGEALTNVIKHASASAVSITLGYDGADLRAEVTDDGVGGADPARGTGLRGIARRLAAFDGTLVTESPPGGPTRVVMVLPCASSSPKTSPSSGTG